MADKIVLEAHGKQAAARPARVQPRQPQQPPQQPRQFARLAHGATLLIAPLHATLVFKVAVAVLRFKVTSVHLHYRRPMRVTSLLVLLIARLAVGLNQVHVQSRAEEECSRSLAL